MRAITSTQKNTWINYSRVRILLCSLLFQFILQGCSGIPIAYYDSTTYTQLTSLKAETMLLVESFDSKTLDSNQSKIDKTTLNLRKAYEYEVGKGKPNSDVAKQLKKIVGLFDEDVDDYKENGPKALGKKYFIEASKVLGQAFDIAISTENLKNKDKR